MPDETPPAEAPPDETPPPETPPSEPELGDAGKRALEAERKAAKAAEKRAKEAEKRLAEFEEANATEAEKALKAAREEGRTEALSVANKRIIRAELKTAAAGILADPDDATVHIDASMFEVDDDGNVDTKAIKAEVERLAKAKPYLTAGSKPAPLPGGGATPSNGQDPNQWFRDLARGAKR